MRHYLTLLIVIAIACLPLFALAKYTLDHQICQEVVK